MESCCPSHRLPAVLQEHLDAVLASGEPYLPSTLEGGLQFPLQSEDRSLLPQIISLRNSRSEIFGAVILLQDVTQFRLLDDVKTNLVATASHELKSSLTSIRTSLHLLCDGSTGTLNEQQQELADVALDELARFDSGAYEMQYDFVPPNELARAATTYLNKDASALDIKLQLDLDESLPLIAVDRGRIEHAVENLLENAIKYSPAGTTVTIGCRSPSKTEVSIYVRDQGPGISPECQHSVFNRFFRIPGSYKSGSGLGLSIAVPISC